MGSFKVKFDIRDYATVEEDVLNAVEYHEGILPSVTEYQRHDEIINYKDGVAGNIEKCIWKRQPVPAILNQEFIRREVNRILRTGVWIFIKDEPVWIPPNYYFFLQYFTTGGAPPQFRIKRLKHVYFKIKARNNPRSLGTYTIKNRQDGETTSAMSDCLWEVADGNMDFGQIGMQSKTRDTVMRSCWRTLIMAWNTVPKWLKDTIYSDFISGDRIAETMKFMRQETNDMGARDILLSYGASTHNAFDSFNNMRRCVLDEVNKYQECSFYATFLNYEKFIAAGASRKGLFDIFSSPADTNGKHNDEALAFWKGSDSDNLINGTTETRIFRYYSNPLDGIEGFYDEYGDCDANSVYAHIMARRKSVPKEFLMGEIRAYPLDENEMFGSFEGGSVWTNHKGMKDRKVFLINRRFKNTNEENKTEPTRVFGNLEREGGYIDGDVVFRQADKETFDLVDARFCFSYMPTNKEPLKNIFKPPLYVENCLGLDPFNNRYEAKNVVKQSMGAMVNRKFRDLHRTGWNKCPTMIYLNRPEHQQVLFEDCLRAAIFNRALIQYENRSDKFANYAEDRGYSDWLLPEMGADADSKRKGDAPSGGGKNAFLNEGIGLIDAHTNTPLNILDPYLLDYYWFPELLDDYLQFAPLDTHKSDLTMADISSLVGCVKILNKKVRKPSNLNSAVMDYLLS